MCPSIIVCPVHFIRAQRTAELVLEGRDVPIYTDRRIQEIGFGEWEGLPRVKIILKYQIQISRVLSKSKLYSRRPITEKL